MQSIVEALRHTPWWVFAIFAFLVYRAVKASRPNITQPWRMAVIPGILTCWGLVNLVQRFPLGLQTVAGWILSLGLGAIFGWLLLRNIEVRADHAKGLLWRPGDWSYPPLIIAIFAIKYAFGYLSAVEPARLGDPAFQLAEIVTSGVITGIFVGKFMICLIKYRAAPSQSLGQAAETSLDRSR